MKMFSACTPWTGNKCHIILYQLRMRLISTNDLVIFMCLVTPVEGITRISSYTFISSITLVVILILQIVNLFTFSFFFLFSFCFQVSANKHDISC